MTTEPFLVQHLFFVEILLLVQDRGAKVGATFPSWRPLDVHEQTYGQSGTHFVRNSCIALPGPSLSLTFEETIVIA